MRIGISITSRHTGAGPMVAVANVLERAKVAAEAGLDHLSLGDHHSNGLDDNYVCLLYTSPSPRDQRGSRMPSSA